MYPNEHSTPLFSLDNYVEDNESVSDYLLKNEDLYTEMT